MQKLMRALWEVKENRPPLSWASWNPPNLPAAPRNGKLKAQYGFSASQELQKFLPKKVRRGLQEISDSFLSHDILPFWSLAGARQNFFLFLLPSSWP